MNQVEIRPFGISTSQFGFGCSSIVGVLTERESKALIDAAYDAGIRHFDVARSYGYGAAESLLANALGGRRSTVTIASKFGLPVPRNQELLRSARNLLRPVVKHLSGLRARSRSAMSAIAPPVDFTVDQARDSLQTSLREFKTDHLDLFLLHEARADALADPRLLEFLEGSVQAGTIRGFGVGSDRENLPALFETLPAYCPVVQHQWSALLPHLVIPDASFRITHGSLLGAFQLLSELFRVHPQWALIASEAANIDLARAENLSAVLLRSAVLKNPGSITLFSARSGTRIEQNVRSLGNARLDEHCERFMRFAAAHREQLLANEIPV